MRSVILLVAGAICVAVGLVLRRTGRAAPAEEAMPAMSRTWESEPERIAFSSESLSVSRPGLSARTTLTVGQRDGLLAGLVVLVLGLVAEPHWTGLVLIGSCTVGYASSMAVRLWLYRSSLKGTELVQFSDAELGAAPDEVFKPYTVLVPVFREPEVMDELVRHLRLLDYPVSRSSFWLKATTLPPSAPAVRRSVPSTTSTWCWYHQGGHAPSRKRSIMALLKLRVLT